jgi:hypothetical protein
MISQDVIIDENFNSLSVAAQNIFIRLIAVSDDFGFVPANKYTLDKLINTPKKIDLNKCLKEIFAARLGHPFSYDGKEFLFFKRDRFDDYQSYLIAKRTKSEYLRLSREEILSEKFQELLRNSGDFSKSETTSIDSIKHKVESVECKVESRKQKEFEPPTISEVTTYFCENGFSESVARKAFEHYNVADWFDSQGHKVRNWKQKMISVWFKEENRNGTHQEHSTKGTRSPGQRELEELIEAGKRRHVG